MSEKKKGIDYEAGHKRETRKSYQTFLEELMSDPSAEDTSGSAADTSDDASVRRSKRTPVPKRGFKLIDDYDSKEHPGKKKFKSGEEGIEQRSRGEKESDEESKRDVESEEIKVEHEVKKNNKGGEQISEETCGEDEAGGSESPAPRKSGRARKAKTFEDSIMPEIKSRARKSAELATSDLSDAESEILKKKVLHKLTANTPISVKEETIIGKDNVEYLYRNVFVTEILDSKRKRTCRLSKDSDSKEKTDKVVKSDVTKDNQEKDSAKETNKETQSTDTIKRKKSDSKLKSTPDKTTSTKASPKPTQLNSSAEISESKISEPKKRKSIEKEKDISNEKNESKKSTELNEIKKTLDILDEPKRKRSSGDKHDLKKAIEMKKSSIELHEGTSDSGKQKISVKVEDDVHSNIESKKEKKDVEKPHESKLKKHTSDEKKTPRSEEKKKVKFAEKEEIKVFEKEVEYVERPPKRNCRGEKKTEGETSSASPFNDQVIPTLADSVKSRRKEKEKKSDHAEQASPEPLDKSSPSPLHHESKKNKRKTPKEEIVTSPTKTEVKEHRSPMKSEKTKSVKEKEIDKSVKESKKVKAGDSTGKVEERELSPKKESSKHVSGKKKLSPSSSKKNKSIENIISQLAENLEPSAPKKKKSKTKQEHVASENEETSSSSMKDDHEEAPIVLTFKSSDITNISPPKKTKEQKSHSFDKTSTKLSKKSELKKNKKQNKKKAKKLIVSFKNNQSFQPKKKKTLEKEGIVESPVESPIPSSLDTSSDTSKQDTVSPEKSPPPIFLDPVPETLLDVTPPDEDEEVKHKKKSKKKSKTKLKKHQKIVNVETFTVADQTVVKVKKKKIYKNRNGEKVLIRLIKNHCNKNGDIVKTETIVVENDAPPIDDEKEKVTSTPETPKSIGFPTSTKTPLNTAFKELESSKKVPEKTEKVSEKGIPEKSSSTKEINEKKKSVEKKGSGDKKSEKKNVEKRVAEKKHAEKSIPTEKSLHDVHDVHDKRIKEDSPEYSPHLDNVIPTHSAPKRKSKFKHSSESKSNFKSNEKRPIFKKSQKIMKKPLSRPANKNVTVGGKVVGKTTKGMKKTGGDNVEPPPVNKAIVKSSNVFEPIPPEIPTVPVTEPKNVYNFFCRKYRPIVVQQFPKADFSEISRRLAALWKTLSETERQDQRDKFEELHSVSQQKLAKLGRLSPTMWSESDLKFIKKNISENDSYTEVFTIPKYPVKRLSPIDMAAHLSLLGDSLNVISGALQQQSSMTVHGAMSVLLDSILSALAPLIFFTSHIPEMKSIDDSQQARILDNLAYILPGL